MGNIQLSQRTKGFISIIVVMLIWGSSFTVTKVVVTEVQPFIFATLRHIIASIVLLPFYLIHRKKVTQPLPYGKLALMGLTGITVYYCFFNSAMSRITASTGALVEGLIPVVIAVLAALILKEHLHKKTVTGIVLSVTGVILVGFVGTAHQPGNTFLGSFLMVCAVLLWGMYTMLSRSLKSSDIVVVTSVSTFIGTAFLLPVFFWEIYQHGMPVISTKAWVGMTYLGCFSSALAYFLYNRALESLPAAQVGNFLNLNPVIGALIAYLFLKDTITSLQLAGAVLVLAGIWLSNRKVSPEQG
ncbi:MAG TPA: EamA family transporter [Chitinophaga sp.]|uniref:DMT family transporter n=1 Tax=Chitinophaga sp. TaxID=1869181 RepID=UPI002B77C15E|nr:EamA family transporter [Chitinophaga sp.]HVI46372.1 EamA family transporter [Chitinophaga sp.]